MAHRTARTAARLAGAVLTASAVAVVGPAVVPASAAGVVQLGHSPTPTYATVAPASAGPAELPRSDVRVVRVR